MYTYKVYCNGYIVGEVMTLIRAIELKDPTDNINHWSIKWVPIYSK